MAEPQGGRLAGLRESNAKLRFQLQHLARAIAVAACGSADVSAATVATAAADSVEPIVSAAEAVPDVALDTQSVVPAVTVGLAGPPAKDLAGMVGASGVVASIVDGAGASKRGPVPLEQYFKIGAPWEGKFSQWDAHGVPTHTADGEPITKSMRKRVDKSRAKHTAKWKKRDPDGANHDPTAATSELPHPAQETQPRQTEPVWGKFLKDFVETEW